MAVPEKQLLLVFREGVQPLKIDLCSGPCLMYGDYKPGSAGCVSGLMHVESVDLITEVCYLLCWCTRCDVTPNWPRELFLCREPMHTL